MEYRWVGKNIDLDAAKGKIEKFLKEQGCRVDRHELPTSFSWKATFRQQHKARQVTITVTGEPNDLRIDFGSHHDLDRVLTANFVMQFLGAGALLREGYDSRDFYKRLEEKFWIEMEKAFG